MGLLLRWLDKPLLAGWAQLLRRCQQSTTQRQRMLTTLQGHCLMGTAPLTFTTWNCQTQTVGAS